MKYLLLVCWDTEQMNAQADPEPSEPEAAEEGFPWVDDLQFVPSGDRERLALC
jgi:hypothetical protein